MGQDTDAIFATCLALGDDALVLGHRLSQWSSTAPTLEEDIALSNLGLDMIGQARLFYQLGATIEGKGRDEDKLAYFRDASAFRNLLLMELPNGDFAVTMARHLAVAAFLEPYYRALAASPHQGLAEIAAKAVREMTYHVRHAGEWIIRLGDGTQESRRRMIAGLDAIWPYTGELFAMDEAERSLAAAGIVPDRATIRPQWNETIARVLAEATLDMPEPAAQRAGGRQGHHTEHLAPMLADMQSLARAHPEATW
ncbi:MAG: 1,2-phenylacetyl-CoA epoxidase subunit PaaC [Hyphomicrobiaceae bacterium]